MKRSLTRTTRLLHNVEGVHLAGSPVNPPVERASTIVFDTYDSLRNPPVNHMRYGRYGQGVHHHFRQAFAALESGAGTVLASSGLQAIALTILGHLGPEDEVLMVNSCYHPVRWMLDTTLKRQGIGVRYYDAHVGAEIAQMVGPKTRMVWLESPGSLSFEVQDVPAMVKALRGSGVLTAMDNTWSAGLGFQPLAQGVDLVVQSVTKYITGHADALLGAVSARDPATLAPVGELARSTGVVVAPDTVWLALRGLRTLEVRFARSGATGLKLARWLEGQGQVLRVLHPALASHPDHGLWQRDFAATGGLFGFVLKPQSEASMAQMLDKMTLFRMGYSWGGYESLMIPTYPHTESAERKKTLLAGQYMRLAAGLEDPDDLIEDLKQALARL